MKTHDWEHDDWCDANGCRCGECPCAMMLRCVPKWTPRLRHKATVLKHVFSDVVLDIDGYRVWWPQEARGAWTAEDLRVIADLIDEANKKWDVAIQRYFEKERMAQEAMDERAE